ncbi:hypothetical protein V6R21_31295 [Limibacter armeniacum]|uniref:hypothetical protein n=1 Tax=Limibacter armeniacum TaxID=466084 RepID=UPI002FE54465
MKILLIAFFLLFSGTSLFAQHAVLKAGAGVGYEYMLSSKWNKAIDEFNNQPDNALFLPNLEHGFRFGAAADFLVYDGITVGASFTVSKFKTSSSGAEGQSAVDMKVRFNNISLDGDVYLFKFFENRLLPKVKESFFVRVSPTFYMMKANVNGLELPANDPNNPTAPPVTSFTSSSNGFGLGLGAGYQVYVTDRLLLTPLVKMDFAIGNQIEGLSAALNTTSNYDKSGTIRPSFEVKLSYAILQRLPICPIKSCKVQQEHRHGMFGEKALRGNPYTLRQNQKYGDIHRGDAKHTQKTKPYSTEKDVKKRVNKRKKRKRRLIIIGGE